MDYAIEWVHLLLRWMHLITGIAWIGSSFYFMWLDFSLEPPKEPDERLKGESWSVHGGGFYHVKKYLKSPAELPKTLHWFKWEAYTTWITGFLLLVFMYYLQADRYMIDSSKAELLPWQAVVIGLSALVGSWVAYNQLCRSFVGKNGLATALIGFAGLLGLTYLLGLYLSDRGAFFHAGAIMGSVMVGNVFFIIIPNQKKIVASLIKGEDVDPSLGAAGKLRSTHNNYMTLPVLIVMISGHFPLLFSNGNGWWVLGALIVIGGVLRHFFNLKNQGRIVWWLPALSMLGFVLLAMALHPSLFKADVADDEELVVYEQIEPLLSKHCASCHSDKPTFPGILQPPKGVIVTNKNQARIWSGAIKSQVIDTQVMPLGNLTEMTLDERALIGKWIAGGAK